MRYLSTDLFRRRTVSRADQSNTDSRHPVRCRHPHLPQLFYAANNRRWAEVRRRSQSHPHEVFVQEDLSGNTALHVACRHDPPVDIVRCLLRCATVKNAEGATALHVAASHRCSADVIRTLIEDGSTGRPCHDSDDDEDADNVTSPTAALTRVGRAPIHYACMSFRGLSVAAFTVLLEATIKASTEASKGSNDSDNDIISLDDISIMSKDEDDDDMKNQVVNTMTLRDKTGQTPLGLLFRRYRERVRCVIKLVEAQTAVRGSGTINPASTAAAHAVQADLGELWEKSRLIVSTMADHHLKQDDYFSSSDGGICEFSDPAETAAAMEAAAWAASKHQGTPTSTDQDHPKVGQKTFRIVHASVGLTGYGCPPEMIRLAISVHPNQVREMDEEGRLPIHIAAIAASSVAPDYDPIKGEPTSDDDSMITSSTLRSRSSTNTFMTTLTNADVKNPFDQVIRILLRHYPDSARIPNGKNGRLPFTLAVDAGRRTWKDGLRALFEAHPAAVESRDNMNSTLYPSLFALIGNAEEYEGRNETAATTRIRSKSYQKKTGLRSTKQSKAVTSVFEVLRAKPNFVEKCT